MAWYALALISLSAVVNFMNDKTAGDAIGTMVGTLVWVPVVLRLFGII